MTAMKKPRFPLRFVVDKNNEEPRLLAISMPMIFLVQTGNVFG